MAEPVKASKEVADHVNKLAEFHVATQTHRRNSVVRMASRILDVLKGNDDRVTQSTSGDILYEAAPEQIPRLDWNDIWSDEDSRGPVTTGSIGEFFSDRFSDELPSDVFNTGFYAGILAVKHGLIDPEQFLTDEELGSIED